MTRAKRVAVVGGNSKRKVDSWVAKVADEFESLRAGEVVVASDSACVAHLVGVGAARQLGLPNTVLPTSEMHQYADVLVALPSGGNISVAAVVAKLALRFKECGKVVAYIAGE